MRESGRRSAMRDRQSFSLLQLVMKSELELLQQFGCVFSCQATKKKHSQLTERHSSSHTVNYICTNSQNMYLEQSLFVDFRDPKKEYMK